MKVYALAAALLVTPVGSAGDAVLHSLRSPDGRNHTPDSVSAWNDISEITLEWVLPADAEHAEKRSFLVRISPRILALPERADPRYWSASVNPANVKLNGFSNSYAERSQWLSAPRMSRDEFVAIVSRSQAELARSHAGEQFKYVYVDYHTVLEHEEELARSLRQVLAGTKGEIEPKHRGLMLRMRKAFESSQAIAMTRERLKLEGLDFASGRMVGDYYTPVNPGLARTWKAASELPGFGLAAPPRISFDQAEPRNPAGKVALADSTREGQWEPVQEGTGGVTVDRSNGDVFIVVTGTEIFKNPGQGIWKSTDGGTTIRRVDGDIIGGRCETGYALCHDPNGKRLFCFMLDGPSGYTLDGGKTWERLGQVNRGWDFAAVDWSVAKPQVLFGFEHENGGKYHLSSDGGRSWTNIGESPNDARGTFGVGVVDAKTLVRWSGSTGGIERSLDAGATWTKVSDETPVGHVMVVLKDVCYWVGQKGLLVSKDKGATWTLQGQPAQAAWGPYFGKNEKHVVVAGKNGVHETTDAGQNWLTIATLPEEFKNPPGPGWYLNFAFDPVHNHFYASWMGKPTYRFKR